MGENVKFFRLRVAYICSRMFQIQIPSRDSRSSHNRRLIGCRLFLWNKLSCLMYGYCDNLQWTSISLVIDTGKFCWHFVSFQRSTRPSVEIQVHDNDAEFAPQICSSSRSESLLSWAFDFSMLRRLLSRWLFQLRVSQQSWALKTAFPKHWNFTWVWVSVSF